MPDLGGDALRLDLPCDARFLLAVRLLLSGTAARADLTVAEINDLQTAVGEACNNCIEHAFTEEERSAGKARMQITITVTKGEVKVEVEDSGRGFDPKRVARPLVPDVGSTKGLGLYLAEQLTDEMRVESAPGSGTKVTLVKRQSR